LKFWQTDVAVKDLDNIKKNASVSAKRKLAEVEVNPKDTVILQF